VPDLPAALGKPLSVSQRTSIGSQPPSISSQPPSVRSLFSIDLQRITMPGGTQPAVFRDSFIAEVVRGDDDFCKIQIQTLVYRHYCLSSSYFFRAI
jgi:hypothetical protein